MADSDLWIKTEPAGGFRWRRKRYEPMPGKFEPLAAYNAEVARGIVHTAEWDARMGRLQEEFWQWQRASA